MARFRHVQITGNVLTRDDSARELVYFDEDALRQIKVIGDNCFGTVNAADVASDALALDGQVRDSHKSASPWNLDLSLLENCLSIGACFAVGHYGPITLPANLETVGPYFMMGSKTRGDLTFPPTLRSFGSSLLRAAIGQRITLPSTLDLPEDCFRDARVESIQVPPSVTNLGAGFCSGAAIGVLVLQAARSRPAASVLNLSRGFLQGAVVETLNVHRCITSSDAVLSNAAVSVLCHTGPARLQESVAFHQTAEVKTVVIGDLRDASIFPRAVIILGDQQILPVAVADDEQTAHSEHVEALVIPAKTVPDEVTSVVRFEREHEAHVKRRRGVIDMRRFIKCDGIGSRCFENLRDIETLLFPPNVTSIGADFMIGLDCPKLQLVLPTSLRQIGPRAFRNSRIQSVDFKDCGQLTALPPQFLMEATLDELVFPPMLKSIRTQFISGAVSPSLRLEFPETLQDIEWAVMDKCTVFSIDFEKCGSLTTLPPQLLMDARLEELKLPPKLKTVRTKFLSGAVSPNLRLNFPDSLDSIEELRILEKCTVHSVDFEKCGSLTTLPQFFLSEARLKELRLPPHLRTVKQQCFWKVNSPTLDLVFPTSLDRIDSGVMVECTFSSVDFAACKSLLKLPSGLLQGSRFERFAFPPDATTIGDNFLSEVVSPGLRLVFPLKLSDIQWGVLRHSTVRSVSFAECGTLHALPNSTLEGAKFENFDFPQNVKTIGTSFMKGAVSPSLALEFPVSLRTLSADALGQCNFSAVDFSQCVQLVALPQKCLSNATFQSFKFPPKLVTIDDSFMKNTAIPELELSFPESLQKVRDYCLQGCQFKKVKLSHCHLLRHIRLGFLKSATVESLEMPEYTVLEADSLSCLTCKQFEFLGTPVLERIGDNVLQRATISTVTVSNCPALSSIGDNFLSGATLDEPATLVLPPALSSLGQRFCAETRMQGLDMQSCDSLGTLQAGFLFKAVFSPSSSTQAPVIRLPQSIAVYENHCFAECKGISTVEVAPSVDDGALHPLQTPLQARPGAAQVSIGDYFGSGSDVTKVSWPRCKFSIGHSFFKNVNSLRIPDALGFYTVGNDFCAGVGDLTVDFRHSCLSTIGTGFLHGSKLNESVDELHLGHGTFSTCADRFMDSTTFTCERGKVTLPSSVSSIGPRCCVNVKGIVTFAFSAQNPTAVPAQLLSIGDDFLRGCVALKTVRLPHTVCSFGSRCFMDCPSLHIELHLPVTSRIGNDFMAKSKTPRSSILDVADATRIEHRGTVSFRNVNPWVVIGDNFVSHSRCTALEFTTTRSNPLVDIHCPAVKTDTLVHELEKVLVEVQESGNTHAASSVRELLVLRTVLVAKLAKVSVAFRSVASELSQLSNELSDEAYIKALTAEMRLEEASFFRRYAPVPVEPVEDWAAALRNPEQYPVLRQHLKNQNRLFDDDPDFSELKRAPLSSDGKSTVGRNFLTGVSGLDKLDMSNAMHTSLGDRFAADSSVREVRLPPSVKSIGKGMCDGCLATVAALPHSNNKSDCYLSAIMRMHSEKERIDTLLNLRELLPKREWASLARWLLEEKCFAEFKGVFNIHESTSSIEAADLRHVGGSVDDLPRVPSDVVVWPNFDLDIASHDTRLSLLHWAVKYSRQFSQLLTKATWSLRDLALVTEQGFTALHYAVLYDIEISALKTLLAIASNAEIHRTWSDAWAAGGARFSPLHLAYFYGRDAIIDVLLAFEWDPTESIKGNPNDSAAFMFDAYDQSIVALGQARAAALLSDHVSAAAPLSTRFPIPVQLFHAAVLLCVKVHLEAAIYCGHSFAQGIHNSFVLLNHNPSIEFPALSQNKWSDIQQPHVVLALRGLELEKAVAPSSRVLEEYLQDAIAACRSDLEYNSDVRIHHRQILSDTSALKHFVMTQTTSCDSEDDVPTVEFVFEVSALVQTKLLAVKQAVRIRADPQLTADALLLRVQSTEEGLHRGKAGQN